MRGSKRAGGGQRDDGMREAENIGEIGRKNSGDLDLQDFGLPIVDL